MPALGIELAADVADTDSMEVAAETSAGPLELDVRQVGGATVVALAGSGETWNSTYTPVPLAAFLADFARLPEAEAAQLSTRVLGEWAASPESAPPKRPPGPRALAAFAPAAVITCVTLLAIGVIVYIAVRVLIAAATA
jgi:hypothetical protein